nr:periplasmic heavy metal sensor [Chiayiivirga flava]
MSRTARIVVLASLALNVLLAVALVLAVRDGERDPPRRHAPALPGMFDPRALRDALPPERRAVVDGALEVHRGAIRARLGDLFDARRGVREAMLAPTFDRAALDAAFERLRTAETATATQAQAMLGDVLAQTTLQERRVLAERLERRPGRARDGGRERDRGRDRAPRTQD